MAQGPLFSHYPTAIARRCGRSLRQSVINHDSNGGADQIPKLIECIQNWVTRREGRTIKIKTQVGERSLEVEYSPTAMSQAELKGLVNTLMRAIEKQH